MTDRFIVTKREALALIDEELAKRHVAQKQSGLIRLPRRLPKPEPPPEFWTSGEQAMGAPLELPAVTAAAKLRKMLHDRRYGIPHTETDDAQTSTGK